MKKAEEMIEWFEDLIEAAKTGPFSRLRGFTCFVARFLCLHLAGVQTKTSKECLTTPPALPFGKPSAESSFASSC